MAETASIFLSHTSSDADVAPAVRDVLVELMGAGTIRVHYSTSKELEGGISSGEDWFE